VTVRVIQKESERERPRSDLIIECSLFSKTMLFANKDVV
jgi:hypothetical protein